MKNTEHSGILFSVIVPVYQVEDYLAESIESVLKQSFREYEIILIDDGSTDKSAEICDLYANKYEFIDVIHQNNCGLSAARNRGINASTGEYLVFLDSDDKLCADALSELKDFIQMNLFPDVIAHRRTAFDCNCNEYVYPHLYANYIGEFHTNAEAFSKFQNMPDGNMGAWNFTVKRDYIIQNNLLFYEGIYHEDEEWVPRILLGNGRVCFSDILFYAYRIDRNNSITNSLNIKRLFDKLTVIDRLEEIFENADSDVKECIRNRCCSLLFGMLCEISRYKHCDKYNELLPAIKEKTVILKYSSKKVHRITCFVMDLTGFEISAYILTVASSQKRHLK